MKNMKKIGLALAILSVFGLIGIAGAQSQVTVTALYESTYTPATCVFGTYDGTASPAAAVTLTPAGAPLYVQNLGSPDSLGTQSTMSVSVAYQDNSGASAGTDGWYQGGTWVPGISTSWTAPTPGVGGPYALDSLTSMLSGTPPESAAYSSLSSGTGTWSPITFSVVGGTTLPAGAYNQQIVLLGSC